MNDLLKFIGGFVSDFSAIKINKQQQWQLGKVYTNWTIGGAWLSHDWLLVLDSSLICG